MTNELINSLACITCGGDLALAEGVLSCTRCASTVPVRRGIPSFLEATATSRSAAIRRQTSDPLFDKHDFDRWEGDKSVETCEHNAEHYSYKEFEIPILNSCRGRTLEVGCGSGRVMEKISIRPEVEWVAGIDPSLTMLGKSAEKGFDVVQGVAERLPFKDGYFDSAVSVYYTMRYIDRKLAFKEIYRVLKPGGQLAFDLLNYFQVVAQEAWYTMRTRNITAWPADIRRKSREQYWHLNIKIINSELKLLATAGFEVSEVMTTKFIPFARKRHRVYGFWNGTLACLVGRNIILICRKP